MPLLNKGVACRLPCSARSDILDIDTILLPRTESGSEGRLTELADAESIVETGMGARTSGLRSLMVPLGSPTPTAANRPDAGNPEGPLRYECVAAGGTFDRLHAVRVRPPMPRA